MDNNYIYRAPTEFEMQRISRYMEKSINSEIKIFKSLDVIFTALGIFMLVSIMSKTSKPIIAVVVGVAAFAVVFVSLYQKKLALTELQAYKNGEYSIVEGYCSKLETDPEHVGRQWAEFTSRDGSLISKKNFVLTNENNSVNMPLILVCPKTDRIRKKAERVFSEYMLSDEFLNK